MSNNRIYTYIYCIYFFICVLTLNTGVYFTSTLLLDFSSLQEIMKKFCFGVYCFIIGVIYVGLFCLIVKNSFHHVEQIIALKSLRVEDSSNDVDYEELSLNTRSIFKHIILNLLFLVLSILLYMYFNSVVVKLPLILYVCWTLGFTASFPINEELIIKMNKNKLKDYVLSKSLINTGIILGLYYLVSYNYYDQIK